MSKNSTLPVNAIPPEVMALIGGAISDSSIAEADRGELEAALLAKLIRGSLLEAAREEKVSVRQLAKRLKVSPAAVSRHLSSEGDIRISTAALMAGALGRKWIFELKKIGSDHSSTHGNNVQRLKIYQSEPAFCVNEKKGASQLASSAPFTLTAALAD